jgi:hypothetical protein
MIRDSDFDGRRSEREAEKIGTPNHYLYVTDCRSVNFLAARPAL